MFARLRCRGRLDAEVDLDWNQFQKLVTHPFVQSAFIIVLGYLSGVVADLFGVRAIGRLVAKTRTKFDDKIVEECRRPIRTSCLLAAMWFAISFNDPLPQVTFLTEGLISSWAIVIWTRASFRISSLLITWLASVKKRFTAVTPRTIPAWDMTAHLLLTVITAYFFFLAWDFDVTGWLASAGIIGMAVGFGAKDTMANLFAGMGILADNTYKLGDFLLLDTGERGRVTDIGLRSTRLLTQDEMEIIVPNSAMATTKIINESGGPRECERIYIDVAVAYGSDVAAVREVLLSVAKATEGVLTHDPRRLPAVMFVAMGDFALQFKLLCFISLPEHQPIVIDRLNTGVYNALGEAEIEIPFPQHDVHLFQDKG
jgi:small-conductance mechanosensitive channel